MVFLATRENHHSKRYVNEMKRLLFLILCLAVSGCKAPKPQPEAQSERILDVLDATALKQFKKIETGMTRNEVIKAVGAPSVVRDNTLVYIVAPDHFLEYTVTIQLENNKVSTVQGKMDMQHDYPDIGNQME